VRALDLVSNELASIVDSTDEEEAMRAKNQFKSSLYASYEHRVLHCQEIGRELLLTGKVTPLEEIKADVDAITVGGLRDEMRSILSSKPCLVIISPKPEGAISIPSRRKSYLESFTRSLSQRIKYKWNIHTPHTREA